MACVVTGHYDVGAIEQIRNQYEKRNDGRGIAAASVIPFLF